jgi:hypothetical protein
VSEIYAKHLFGPELFHDAVRDPSIREVTNFGMATYSCCAGGEQKNVNMALSTHNLCTLRSLLHFI